MKFERTTAFHRDAARLPPEHYAMFKEAVYKHFLPALEQGAHTGRTLWPSRLRIHKLTDTDVYSLTWNFASPDGRATFEFSTADDGEPLLLWRRIGDHSIYDSL
ncbi:hypothetical protein [Sphaerimonospora thailandensis]|uniref:Uncharacterized protein n=1 Tax=Sphaerimonospora thailandensis TaxID=795644 RepID=A0A8J3RBH3_9ACTN|nr:hypothetical protein [Sphaerimonospora thailandensis]GIH72637.1 hypothetical protein Mth01_48900 [Sphaerimonospora thailandensis]